jgi:hypothetical protein
MSFSSREIRKLVKYQLAKNPDWKIFKNTVVGGDGMLPTYSTGGEYAYVMTQDAESIEHRVGLGAYRGFYVLTCTLCIQHI